jgi:hypothetical protein
VFPPDEHNKHYANGKRGEFQTNCFIWLNVAGSGVEIKSNVMTSAKLHRLGFRACLSLFRDSEIAHPVLPVAYLEIRES